MTVVDNPRSALRTERLSATRKLLEDAAICTDLDERQAILHEVAALNADDALAVASALYRRQRPEATDEPALLAVALDTYMDAVLAIDPRSCVDVLAQVAPALSHAVTRFNRDLVRRHVAPGIGERSTLR